MTRLAENRAKAQLAQKAGVDITEVTNMTIWGITRHPDPDAYNAIIKGPPRLQNDRQRIVAEGNIYPRKCNNVAAAIIKARGSSRQDRPRMRRGTVRSLTNDTAEGDWHSVAFARMVSYGVEDGLIAHSSPHAWREVGNRAGRAV